MISITPKKFKSKNHEIIARFLSTERASTDKYFWGREIKIAVKLVKKYPFEFLIQLKEPFVTKMSSLAWFLTEEGKIHLNTQFFNFKKENTNLTQEAKVIKLSENKLGEDVIIVKKPKTLKEFLNHG